MTLKVTVDGFTFDASEQAAQAIAKLTEKVATKDAEIVTIKADHTKAIAAKDADLARKDAELDALKAKVLSDADLDKRVADRAALIATAKVLAPKVETAGLADAAIRQGIFGVPTFVGYDRRGAEVGRLVGVQPRALLVQVIEDLEGRRCGG